MSSEPLINSGNYQALRREESHGSGPSARFRVGPLTAVLIALSVAVALWSNLGSKPAPLTHLFITLQDDGSHRLLEVSHGEAWRLLTPIFIHYGFLHILFNMLWLKDLGTLVEKRLSTSFLLAFVVVTGVASNFAQFWFAGPFFGGMSGVVYGLLGFVWIWSTRNPAAGFRLPTQTVIMMLLWFVACWAGALGAIANYAHTAGLLIGMAWGYLTARTTRSAPTLA